MFKLGDYFSNQKLINVGYSIQTKEEISILDSYFGDMWLIAAMTGYGKTRFVENLLTQLKDRRIIIFDDRGEHKGLRTLNAKNMDAKADCIPDLVYIEKFGFKLQDFQKQSDWEQMGFSSSGARICAKAAERVYQHRNDFDCFLDMISQIPTKGKDSEMYMTLASIKSKLQNIRNNFVDDRAYNITDEDGDMIHYVGCPFYISDWVAFIKKHKHICLNLHSENNPTKAQLFVGKILSEIRNSLRNEPIVICMEEAHFLYPVSVEEDNIPFSSFMLYNYAKTKHKDSVKLILVTQYPHQLSETALDEVKWFFLGKLENVDTHGKLRDMFNMTSKLNYYAEDNYREWLCYSPIYNKKHIVRGYDSFTSYFART